MENAREKAINLIKGLSSDISLEEIIRQLGFINKGNVSISEESANDRELKKMIAESQAAYKASDFSTTEQLIEEISNRFNDE